MIKAATFCNGEIERAIDVSYILGMCVCAACIQYLQSIYIFSLIPSVSQQTNAIMRENSIFPELKIEKFNEKTRAID